MSFWTGLAGSILVPVAGAVLTRASHEIDPVRSVDDMLFRAGLFYGSVGLASYLLSGRAQTDAMHDFAIGGALANGVIAGGMFYLSTLDPDRPADVPVTAAGPALRTPTNAALFELLTAGVVSDAGHAMRPSGSRNA